MRQDQDYCKRCGNPIEADMIGKTDICGTCADELRGEAETRKSLAEGHGITFPNAEEAIKWLKSKD